jgi:hypothetical protein
MFQICTKIKSNGVQFTKINRNKQPSENKKFFTNKTDG